MTDVDAVWSALSHPVRRRLVELLREGPRTTGDLDAALSPASPSRFATQRHLQVLRGADVVLVTERGRERLNALNSAALYGATIGWLRPADRGFAQSLHLLKNTAEQKEPAMSQVRSMSVHQAITIDAAPERVWSALIDEPSQWWGSPYLLLEGHSPTLTIDARLGGLVCETAGSRQATWGTVTEVAPGEELSWTGGMGMGGAALGVVSYVLEPDGGSTRVILTHEAIGMFPDEAASNYDYGWADLQARLRTWVTDGVAHGVAGTNTAPEFTFTPTSS